LGSDFSSSHKAKTRYVTTRLYKISNKSHFGRAVAVVKVTSQVIGNTQFSESGRPKTISAVKMKFGTIDYVGEGNAQPPFGNNQITGDFSSYG